MLICLDQEVIGALEFLRKGRLLGHYRDETDCSPLGSWKEFFDLGMVGSGETSSQSTCSCLDQPTNCFGCISGFDERILNQNNIICEFECP
jgi:hypothetical protein